MTKWRERRVPLKMPDQSVAAARDFVRDAALALWRV